MHKEGKSCVKLICNHRYVANNHEEIANYYFKYMYNLFVTIGNTFVHLHASFCFLLLCTHSFLSPWLEKQQGDYAIANLSVCVGVCMYVGVCVGGVCVYVLVWIGFRYLCFL